MLGQLEEVLRHERDAAVVLGDRLLAVERGLDDGCGPTSPVLAGVRDAADRLAALELTRCLALCAAGAPADLTADELVLELDDAASERFVSLVADLRLVLATVRVRRDRVRRRLADTSG